MAIFKNIKIMLANHPSIIIEKSEDLKRTFNANTWAFIKDLPVGFRSWIPKAWSAWSKELMIEGFWLMDVRLTNEVIIFSQNVAKHTEATYIT